ncbi:hypothetical protein LTR91_005466 [Friedmanniomyces endolithicus]|uniref:Uncharacterized protein n=1 Tax=Friedmanniomyces endolithicus TaxID=329885 RepID=A0AAN6KU54_9PEZI|nr:hypothetical protein LTR75_007930 [Friedmanniomyces endolithicus]KAK0838462.1 hypothetical protein LTR03_011987 [Friedmanniomyces endolithicus]KAK0855956.1 hypothetical protein LTS02_010818 [Friedmanniomyces endolithicus]KAK0884868.1 hypothetical protein LTR87_001266 [Friedmanniomyces endolithicus]KAK0912211.1 hypothetical protein LTR57_014996 [Friedmanniomyces endolithicus]
MEMNTFALVIAIAGTIMAFPTNPLEGVEPAGDPPHHSVQFHIGTILASLTRLLKLLLPTNNAAVTHRHRDDRPATRNLKTRAWYSADLAAQLDTLRSGKRGCVLNRESSASRNYGGKKAKVTAGNWSPMPGG